MSHSAKRLTSTIDIDIRFSETDAMGVVWHGNFLKFFEDGRERFGQEYGIPYLAVSEKGYFVPIVHSELEFKNAVYYGQKIRVITEFVPVRSAKIRFEYTVINLATGKTAAVGSTTQVFVSQQSRELELLAPPFYRAWKEAHQV